MRRHHQDPVVISIGTTVEFGPNAAWWVFDFVENWANLKYRMIEDIKAKQQEIEGRQMRTAACGGAAALIMYQQDPELAREFLTNYCETNANGVVKEYWEFAKHLIVSATTATSTFRGWHHSGLSRRVAESRGVRPDPGAYK